MRLRTALSLAVALVLCAACTLTRKYVTDVYDYWVANFISGEGETDAGGLQQGEWVYTRTDGTVAVRATYVDDKQSGRVVDYHANGQREFEGFFQDGFRAGYWRYWNENGTPYAEGCFDEGFEEGAWTFHDEQGRPVCAGEYSRGKSAGEWTYFHPSGERSARGWFAGGEKIGTWRYWDETGAAAGVEDHGLPAGARLVRETWQDGGPRRMGLARGSEQIGRWIGWHANGQRRIGGELRDGVQEGTWTATDESGAFLAGGPVRRGVPAETWSVREGSEVLLVDASSPARPRATVRPIAPDLTGSRPPDGDPLTRVRRWIEEVARPIDEAAPLESASPVPVAVGLVEATAARREAPIVAQPFTKTDVEGFAEYRELYASRSLVPARSGGPWGGSLPRNPSADRRMPAVEGRPLPLTRFPNVDGRLVDLARNDGRPTLVIVLRGTVGRGREVCIYCTTQTIALADAAEELSRLAKVVIVYPGPTTAMRALQDAYVSMSPQDKRIPFDLVADVDERLVRALGIESDLADPTSLILDAEGVVRFTYRGADIDDRPSVGVLVNELEKLGGR